MKKKSYPAVLVLLCVLFLVISKNASARTVIDPQQEIELQLIYRDGEDPIIHTSFSIHAVANADISANITLTSDFVYYKEAVTDFAVLSEMDQSRWNHLAETLQSCVLCDLPEPVITGRTNSDGELSVKLHLACIWYLVRS